MAHREQIQFCKRVRKLHPSFFFHSTVLDVGSLSINGNNRRFFRRPKLYIGVDIVKGKNVDVVGKAHEVKDQIRRIYHYALNPQSHFICNSKPQFDIVISTEMLEHDENWMESLETMYDLLRPGGLLLITAGGDGREEHGTSQHHPECSPGTLDYYKNISNEMLSSILKPNMFKEYYLCQHAKSKDLQFYGIKNQSI